MDTNQPHKQNNDLGVVFDATNNTEQKEQKKIEESKKSSPVADTPRSHLGGPGGVFDIEKAFTSKNGEIGTIVSDRKHQRPSVGESLKGAFTEWWGKTSRQLSNTIERVEKNIPKEHEVSSVETREAVIKEAAQHGAIPPKDDHHVVVEKMRTFKGDSMRITETPIIITEAKKKDEPSTWTHTTHTEQSVQKQETIPSPSPLPDFRKNTVAPIVTHAVVRREASTESITTQKEQPLQEKSASIRIPEMTQKEPVPLKKGVYIAPHVQRDTTPTHSTSVPYVVHTKRETKPFFTHTEKNIPSEKEPVVTREPVERHTEPVFTSSPVPPPPSKPLESLRITPEFHGTDTHAPDAELLSVPEKREFRTQSSQTPNPVPSARIFPTWVILAGVVLVGGTLAVILSIYVNVFEKSETGGDQFISSSAIIPSFFSTDSQVSLSLTGDSDTFLINLTNETESAKQQIAQFYPTISSNNVERPATSVEFFTFLDASIDRSTLKALDDTFMIGSITTTKSEPFIIIRSYNFDALFAGLLKWEGYLYTDFAPLFGTQPISNPIFTDAVKNNKSIRILYNDAGGELLLYSFINQNTVVITSSTEALTKLIQKF